MDYAGLEFARRIGPVAEPPSGVSPRNMNVFNQPEKVRSFNPGGFCGNIAKKRGSKLSAAAFAEKAAYERALAMLRDVLPQSATAFFGPPCEAWPPLRPASDASA